jgi:hypothetical protein
MSILRPYIRGGGSVPENCFVSKALIISTFSKEQKVVFPQIIMGVSNTIFTLEKENSD